jgi:hypothetical protein
MKPRPKLKADSARSVAKTVWRLPDLSAFVKRPRLSPENPHVSSRGESQGYEELQREFAPET